MNSILSYYSFKMRFGILVVLIAMIACKNNSKDSVPESFEVNEKLTSMNRKIVEKESGAIEDFIARHNFKTTRTGTGLRYEIYHKGKGKHPLSQDTVRINYRVFLLDGELCYSTDSTGPIDFIIGRGEQIKGLEEGLTYMVPGDKARLIVPSHLAYGMSGDMNEIPPSNALYLDIELVNVNP